MSISYLQFEPPKSASWHPNSMCFPHVLSSFLEHLPGGMFPNCNDPHKNSFVAYCNHCQSNRKYRQGNLQEEVLECAANDLYR